MLIMEKVLLKNIKETIVKNAHFLVLDLTDCPATANTYKYVGAILSDGEQKQKVNLFNPNKKDPEGMTVEALKNMGIVKGSVLKTDICHKGNFYNASNWEANSDPAISAKDFCLSAPLDENQAYAWIIDQIKAVEAKVDQGKTKSLSYLTLQILEKYESEFKHNAAAVSMHHDFLSGLIYHTYRMLKMAIATCEVYDDLDKELMLCGTALHDIGKVITLDTDEFGSSVVNIEGRLLEHSVEGVIIVEKEADKDAYDKERIKLLEHMLTSHHGKLEYGAAVTPAIPEAEMLHLIDMMDSRKAMFEDAYKNQEPGTISENKVFGLENSRIYKPSNRV